MALTDKNIVITPNNGQASDPQIVFSGADASLGPQNITVRMYPTSGGTLSWEGSAGQLFSITNSMTGSIYSVNDVSGIPSIEVFDTGAIRLAQYNGNILIGTATDNGAKLQVNGTTTLSGNLTANASIRETRTAMSANDINLNLGNYFTKTLVSGAVTLSVSNIPSAPTAASFVLDLTNGGSATITWWSGMKWASGTAPTLTATGRDVLGFFTHDAGTTWTGLLLGKDVR